MARCMGRLREMPSGDTSPMYRLATSYEEITLRNHQELKEELAYIKSQPSIEVYWFEHNGSRFVRDFIRVDGRFVEVYVFEPKSGRG